MLFRSALHPFASSPPRSSSPLPRRRPLSLFVSAASSLPRAVAPFLLYPPSLVTTANRLLPLRPHGGRRIGVEAKGHGESNTYGRSRGRWSDGCGRRRRLREAQWRGQHQRGAWEYAGFASIWPNLPASLKLSPCSRPEA